MLSFFIVFCCSVGCYQLWWIQWNILMMELNGPAIITRPAILLRWWRSLSYSRAGPVTGNVYWNCDFDLIHLYGVLCAHYTYLYSIFKDLCEAANNTHCYKCYVYNKTFYETFEIILNYTVMLTSATGLVGNFLSISVLTKTGLCSRFSNLLIMLAYADIRSRYLILHFHSFCFA